MLTHLLRFSRLALLSTLWVLLALGPFLHAHYGSSSRTGLHLDEVSQAVSHWPHRADTAEFSQADAPESPALGVATSHTREVGDNGQPPLDHAHQPMLWASASAGLSRLGSVWQHARPALHATYRVGLPPPALAPPRRAFLA